MGEAFNCRFDNYKSLVMKLFPDLDLSNVTQEVGLALTSKANAQSVLNVGSPTKVPRPVLKVLAIKLCPKIEALAPVEAPTPAPTEVLNVEVISLEDDLMAASKNFSFLSFLSL